MTLLPLFAALALPFAWAAEGPVEAKRAAMERLRARTAALEEAAAELEGLASAHALDRPASSPSDRAALRARVEQGVAELKTGMEGYWELDAIERVAQGSQILAAVFKGGPGPGGEDAVRSLADLGDFPKLVESSIGRGKTALAAEAAAFTAAEARRAESARRRLQAYAAAALFVAAVALLLWLRTGKKPV